MVYVVPPGWRRRVFGRFLSAVWCGHPSRPRGCGLRHRLRLETLESRSLLSVAVMVADFKDSQDRWVSPGFTDVNGMLYFAVDDGPHGRELWRSDGTTEGTKLVKDFNLTSGSYLQNLTNVNGTLYLRAFDGTDTEPWKCIGVDAVEIDINKSGSSFPSGLTNVNGTLYFSANDGEYELWKYDGATPTKINVAAIGSSYPDQLTDVNGTLYFSARDGQHGVYTQLFRCADTTVTTIPLVDGATRADPLYLTNVNGTLYTWVHYSLDGANYSWGLYRVDGTTATRIAVNPGTNWSPTSGMVGSGTTLYFPLYEGEHLERLTLWKCDGASTTRIDVDPSGSPSPNSLTDVNGTLYFSAYDGADRELWKYDGATLTKINVNPAGSSYPVALTNVNGTLFFSTRWTGPGDDLWQYDGSTLSKVDFPVTSYVGFLANINGTLYFAANGDGTLTQLWKVVEGPKNRAPTLGDGNLAAVDEDTINSPGNTVASIFAGKFNDPDPGSCLSGIAVVGNTADTGSEGVWQYSSDGTHWADLGSVNDTGAALSLASTARVRFLPAEDYFGTPPALTVRGMDDTYAGGYSSFNGTTETRVTVATTTHGGSTPLADATSILSTSVNAVNDRPGFTASDPPAVDANGGLQTLAAWVTSFTPGPSNESSQHVEAYLVTDVSNAPLFAVPPAIDTTGTLTYAPAKNAFGTSTFKVTVRDDGGRQNGGIDTSEPQTFTITVNPLANGPVLTNVEETSVPYPENDPATPVTTTITAANTAGPNLTDAVIRITGNYQKGQDLLSFVKVGKIKGTWNAKTGALTLSGTDTVANYETALRSVTYQNTSENPSAAERTVTIQVNDGKTTSNQVTRSITVTPVNDPPVLAKVEPKSLTYKENQKATAVSSSIKVSDADHGNLVGATVQIGDGYNEGQDVLIFTGVAKTHIVGTWDAQSGTMSLTGNDTVANYQKALRAVKFQTGVNPGGATRTVTFTTSDGVDQSVAATRTIVVKPVNDAPVLAGIETTTLAYVKGQAPTAISDTITVADPDNAVLASATVQITGGYKKGQDFLAFEDTDKITGVFDTKKGLLTLTSLGDATVADFEAALRAVTYQNTSESPKTGKRIVSFKVSDGSAWSKTVKRTLQVTAAAAANDAALLAMFGSLGQAGGLPHGRGLQAGRVAG